MEADIKKVEQSILLQQVAEGSEDAFRILFNLYWSKIHRLGLAYTKSPEIADEIVQDVFLSIWLKKEGLTRVKNLDAFIHAIARNQVLNHLKKRLRDAEHLADLARYFHDYQPSPEENLESQESIREFSLLVNGLPDRQKTIYLLRREEGLSLAEIALKLQISVHTVKSHMNKALLLIKAGLSDTMRQPMK